MLLGREANFMVGCLWELESGGPVVRCLAARELVHKANSHVHGLLIGQ